MSNLQHNLLSALSPGIGLSDAMDIAQEALRPLGFDASSYDYSPVPLTHEGEFIVPTVYAMQNTPSDMTDLWCGKRYYAHDPVMDASRETSCPFIWTYRGPQSAIMSRILDQRHRPVVDYLCDTGMESGITVPIRGAGGALATFTAISTQKISADDMNNALSSVGYLAHIFHEAVVQGFPKQAFHTPHVKLTARERQCLQLCAKGLIAKEIAHELGRSVATVTLHLTSATKKLGARNRFHALVLAAHYQLLETIN